MIFYLIHNIINHVGFADEWKESKKNCLTLILGGTLYILLYVLLEYLLKKTDNLAVELLHKFYLWFVAIDVLTMAILYKVYYGRSILNETMANDSEWIFNENDHKYKRKRDLDIDELRKFNDKSGKIEELNEEIEDLRENMQEIENKTNDIEEAIVYHPDGEMAKKLKKDFEDKTI